MSTSILKTIIQRRTFSAFLLLLFIILGTSSSWAQDSPADSTIIQPSDSTLAQKERPVKVKKPKKERLHSPKTAVLMGIIPGGGQIYNKKYWKLPIVYGGMAGLGYFMVSSGTRFQCYRRAYREATDTLASTNFHCRFDLDSVSTGDLLILRNRYQNQFELSSIIFAGFYVLTVVDAYVDAHFYYFDVSDDLSMSIRPRMEINYGRQAIMPSVRMSLRPKYTARSNQAAPHPWY